MMPAREELSHHRAADDASPTECQDVHGFAPLW